VLCYWRVLSQIFVFNWGNWCIFRKVPIKWCCLYRGWHQISARADLVPFCSNTGTESEERNVIIIGDLSFAEADNLRSFGGTDGNVKLDAVCLKRKYYWTERIGATKNEMIMREMIVFDVFFWVISDNWLNSFWNADILLLFLTSSKQNLKKINHNLSILWFIFINKLLILIIVLFFIKYSLIEEKIHRHVN
jgi:hypothetical protein